MRGLYAVGCMDAQVANNVKALQQTPSHCHCRCHLNHLHVVVLNVEEAAAYKEAYARARAIWLKLAAAGPAQINRHILAAMSLLLPQRRICSGGRLSNSDMQVGLWLGVAAIAAVCVLCVWMAALCVLCWQTDRACSTLGYMFDQL